MAILLELVKWIFLEGVGVPDQNVGFVASRGHKRIGLVPARVDDGVLGSEHALDFALHTPDSSYVVIGAGEQFFTTVTPLNGRNKVVLV